MKKSFLYVALGLMGIMGALSIGVVSATTYSVIRSNLAADITITYDANGGVFSDNSTTKLVGYTKNNYLYMANENVQAPDRDGYMTMQI